MNTSRYRFPALLFGFATALSASAEDVPTTEAGIEDLRTYQVEVIFFRYADSVSAGTEVFVPDPPPEIDVFGETTFAPGEIPEYSDQPSGIAEQGERDEPALPDEELTDPDAQTEELPLTGFERLPDDALTLGETWDRLERLDAYIPTLHFAWQQTLLPFAEPEPVSLEELAVEAPGLEGELTLYLSRFLHLGVKLEQLADTATDGGSTSRQPGNPLYEYEGQRFVAEEPGPVFYRIEEDRIFKNGDIRYFDHPRIGLLALITRVEEPEPDDLTDTGEAGPVFSP